MSFEVRDEKAEEMLKSIGGAIGGSLPKDWAFMLMLFKSNEDGSSTFYASNAERKHIVIALKEWIEKQEKYV